MAINSNQRKSDSEKKLTPEQQAALKEWKLTESLLNAFRIEGKDITDVRQRGDSNSETVYEIELQQGEEKRSLYAFYKEDEVIVSTTLDYSDTRFYAYRMYTKRNEVHSVTYGIRGRQWALYSVWPQNANGQSSGGQSLQTVTNVGLTGESLLETVKDIATHNVETLVAPEYLALERFLQDLQDIDDREREREQQNTATTVGVEASTTTTQGEYQGAEAAMSMLERGSSR